MVLTVFVLNLHHMGDRPVPPWVSNLVLIHVARAVGVGAITSVNRRTPACTNDRQKYRSCSTQPRHAVLVQRVHSDRRPVILSLGRKGTTNDNSAATSADPAAAGSPDQCPERIDDYHPGVGETARDRIDFSREWQRIAEVFDRLFFWLFLIATIVTTLVLFHPLTDLCVKRSK